MILTLYPQLGLIWQHHTACTVYVNFNRSYEFDWTCQSWRFLILIPLVRSNNPVILHFLLSLTGSLGCPVVQELTTKALAACPDMLLPYFKALALNFDPQPAAQWMESTEFLIKVRVQTLF